MLASDRRARCARCSRTPSPAMSSWLSWPPREAGGAGRRLESPGLGFRDDEPCQELSPGSADRRWRRAEEAMG